MSKDDRAFPFNNVHHMNAINSAVPDYVDVSVSIPTESLQVSFLKRFRVSEPRISFSDDVSLEKLSHLAVLLGTHLEFLHTISGDKIGDGDVDRMIEFLDIPFDKLCDCVKSIK